MSDYEVAVVGAGVHGAAAAYELGKRGLRTVLLERGFPADGPTTGRSSAICRAFYTNQFLAQVAQASLDIFRDFGARVGGDAGFHRTGALFLHGLTDGGAVEATATMLRTDGIDVELVSPALLAEHHPEVDANGVAMAVWEAGAGYADPVLTTTSYLAAARALGVVVRIKSETLSVVPGSPVLLQLADEEITADRVLIAAGPWSRGLLATCDVDLPTHAERHVVATIRGVADRLPYIVADAVTGWYGKPDVGDRYLVGGLLAEPPVEPDSADPGVADDEVMQYTALLVERFPDLADCVPSGGWAGVYDVSPDWQPIIGEVAANVVVDCGSSGHGFKLAPRLSPYIAALVAGDDVPELREFHPDRFSAGTTLAAGFGDARILG